MESTGGAYMHSSSSRGGIRRTVRRRRRQSQLPFFHSENEWILSPSISSREGKGRQWRTTSDMQEPGMRAERNGEEVHAGGERGVS